MGSDKDPTEGSLIHYKILALFKTIILPISPLVSSLAQHLILIKAMLIEILSSQYTQINQMRV